MIITHARVLVGYLVGLNGSNLFVCLYIVANFLIPSLEGTLADRLCHLRNLDGFSLALRCRSRFLRFRFLFAFFLGLLFRLLF